MSAMAIFGAWWKRWLGPRPQHAEPEWQQAQDLIRAIDAGGLPLNPARVNDLARRLGLEVSVKASMDDTIARIRAALAYRRAHEEK